MVLLDVALLAAAGLAAGAVNAVAGGGTFFTFAALVAVGLPPVLANSTSAVGVTPANVASALGYRREILRHFRRLSLLTAVSLAGGGLGAFALTRIGNEDFRGLVPWLLLFATVLFAASPWIARATRSLASGGRSRAWRSVGAGVQFVTAIYGGFFGAGMGIMMLAALAITEGDDYHVNNAAKHLFAFVIQIIAVVMFVAEGLVAWPQALTIMVAAAIGGWSGVALARRVPAIVIRIVVIATGAMLCVVFFLR